MHFPPLYRPQLAPRGEEYGRTSHTITSLLGAGAKSAPQYRQMGPELPLILHFDIQIKGKRLLCTIIIMECLLGGQRLVQLLGIDWRCRAR